MTPQHPTRAALAQVAPAPDIGRGLLPDYNRAATLYWWLLVVAGAMVLGGSATVLSSLPSQDLWQIGAMSLIAALVGMFPLRIPNSKTSIAAGDIFIFLLLLLHGPFAAVIAATAESAACVWRTSSRWSSRIASPAAAAVAMLGCGHLFTWFVSALDASGFQGDGVTFSAMLLFASVYFLVGPTLVTTILYLKRWRAPTLTEWLTTFGWLGMGYAASASIAAVLYLSFRQFGPTSVIVAAPMIGLFVASLRIYFAQQEASERAAAQQASDERAENAEREAALVANHLHELERSDRRFQSAFAHAAIGMALVARDGSLVQLNAAFDDLFGPQSTPLVGASVLTLIDDHDVPMLKQQMLQVWAGEVQSFRCELRCRHSLGHDVWVSMHGSHFARAENTEAHLIVQAFDVTARRLAEDRLQHLAYHDVLTDLANRSGLHDRVAEAVEAHRNNAASRFSLLHLSFDRVKLLSDSLGRGVGDQFVIAVARRLHSLMRPNDVLARLDGDDFGILAHHPESATNQALALADRLQRAFAVPVLIDKAEVYAGACIGITSGELDYANADEVMRDAQLALTKARSTGKAACAVFDPSLHEQANQRLLLENELRHALDRDELMLAYQPVYAIEPQTLVGFEALARWPHATMGQIAPFDFIPVAEASGLVVTLTRWALAKACRQLSQWRESHGGADDLFVNVNIAGQDLCEPGFADLVRDILAENGLPPRCLTLEITETALMQQLEMGKRTLARLRDLGVGLSVDDFGTGYSSLSHLSTLPINSLKIDRSFVARLDGVSVETEIVRAVVQLGGTLGKRVIAEGIETKEQLERLRNLGCCYAQGFLLARPQSVEQVEALLLESSAPVHAPRTVTALESSLVGLA